MSDKAFFEVGFHTGAFNSAYINFPKAVAWARDHGLRNIECGLLDGVSWNHGLGYFPHISSREDPRAVAAMLADAGVALSQLDGAYPLSGLDGSEIGVPYVENTIRWAALAGCLMVDTTDGLEAPKGMNRETALSGMIERYRRIMETAERYGTTVNIETHGVFTGNPDDLERIIDGVGSDLLKITFDTGNVFIGGQNPVTFLKRFIGRISHLHVKDVSAALADKARGKQSGIGMSHCAIGGGVNAANIVESVKILANAGFRGAVSLEGEARGGPLMEESIAWFRGILDETGVAHDIGESAVPGGKKVEGGAS